MKNTFKIVSLEGTAPFVFMAFALAYLAQLFLGWDLGSKALMPIVQQWDSPSLWVFAGILYVDCWQQALALLLLLGAMIYPLQKAWGARSLLLQILAVSALSVRMGQLGQELVPVFAWPVVSYLWMGFLVRSPESLGLGVWSKFFRLTALFVLWLAALDVMSGLYGENSNQILGMAMGTVLGLILYWVARILGWFVQMVRLKRGLFLPPLGLLLALGHWWVQVKNPQGMFMDSKNLWSLDRGVSTPALQAWQDQVWVQGDPNMKLELAQRCLLGMPMKCDSKLARSILDQSEVGAMQDFVDMGYLDGTEGRQAQILKRYQSLKQPAGLVQSMAAVQVLCGSRDTSLLNPVRGLELAEDLMAKPWPMDLGLEAPYAACLMQVGRRDEAKLWAYRAMEKGRARQNESWIYGLDYALSLDSYFRIAAGQKVYYPEQIWFDENRNAEKILVKMPKAPNL